MSHESIKAQLSTFPATKTFGARFESCVRVLNYNKIHKEIEKEWVQINWAWEYIYIHIAQNIKSTFG